MDLPVEEAVKPRIGSRMWHLWHLKVGESHWEECESELTGSLQSALNPVVERRPQEMRLWMFQTSIWTAVGATAGEVRVLVRSQRMI